MFFQKPPLLKGGGFGFAKTGGILLKLPAELQYLLRGGGGTPIRTKA